MNFNGLSVGKDLPQGITAAFALLGVSLVAAKLLSLVRVLLSLFVLPGVSVRAISVILAHNLR